MKFPTIPVIGRAITRPTRCFPSSNLRAISPEGAGTHVSPVSPDGSLISARAADGQTWLYPIAGGVPRKGSGLQEGETILAWTPDGKAVYAGGAAEMESVISVIDLRTGKRQKLETLGPVDKAGLTYVRQISELFVADGIK